MHPVTPLYIALLTLHFVGLAFGIGGAAVSDAVFAKSIRKADRLTADTVNWMRTFSGVVWVGIAILALSGTGLFLLNPQQYIHSAAFRAKMTLVVILIINGLFLNFYTTSRLTTFNFSDKYPDRGLSWRARKLSFIFGAISALTWYSILFIAMFKSVISLPYIQYIGIYAFLLLGATSTSFLLEKYLYLYFKKQRETNSINMLDIDKIPLSELSSYSARVLEQIAKKRKDAPQQSQPGPWQK